MGNPLSSTKFADFFTEGQFETQEERLAVGETSKKITIAVSYTHLTLPTICSV